MKTLVWILALVAVSCTCGERLVQSSECGKSCYPEGLDGGGVGECKKGRLVCNDDGSTECTGFGEPSAEVCDGLDNDCNGVVDNLEDDPKLCSSVCGQGFTQCIHGRWTTCTAPLPKAEICNGRDDDCDGKVDEPDDMVWPVPECYTGPANTESLGICHAGSNRCVAGVGTCFGEQKPKVEICNGLDDDCDGQIDDGAPPNDEIDFVLIFDNSGSMAGVAANLKAATQTWAAKYSAITQRRYALVAAPDNDILYVLPRKIQDFTDPGTFSAAVQTQTGLTGTGAEPTLDAIYDLIDPANPLQMDWDTGHVKVLVMFSDEEPQAYEWRNNGQRTTVSEVAGLLLLSGYVLHVFTAPDQEVSNPWGVLATAGGGQVWNIQASPLELEMYLDEVIKRVSCH